MNITNTVSTLRYLGIGWMIYRIGYFARKKTGSLKRRFPAAPWQNYTLVSLTSNYDDTSPRRIVINTTSFTTNLLHYDTCSNVPSGLNSTLDDPNRQYINGIADKYIEGTFLYFSRHNHKQGNPVDWLLNPFTGGRHRNDIHWVDYPTFSPESGDIKDVWEPSRFACAFWLSRAYALTGDEKYSETFWQFFESWCEQNPPNMGPNWKCGQETALRSMAWCFALHCLRESPATTEQRVCNMIVALAVHADRIAGNIDYAISQKNNHALSEATGLLTIGLLFPQLKHASRWARIGRNVLEREAIRQIYDDGSYVQHSMNYHRVMLHDLLWAIRLADLNNQPLSDNLKDRFAKAASFLFDMMDPDTGCVPNYGPNDGALVLPLSSCDYTDYRPTIQAAMYQATGTRVLPSGPWDEMLLWLFGPHALKQPAQPKVPKSVAHHAGGYYTIRGEDTWAMIRCHTYRDRPAHVDMLHLDVWWRGVNILSDSGTYSYYIPKHPVLEKYFKSIRAHNTIEIDDTSPLRLVSRFLWLPWPSGRCDLHEPHKWQGQHDAYNRQPWNVIHRRTVELIQDATWQVTDKLIGSGSHTLAVYWHLADYPHNADGDNCSIVMHLPTGLAIISVDAGTDATMQVHRGISNDLVGGWSSEYYADIHERPTMVIRTTCTLPATLTTRIELRESVTSS